LQEQLQAEKDLRVAKEVQDKNWQRAMDEDIGVKWQGNCSIA